jgi:hypothetical protein
MQERLKKETDEILERNRKSFDMEPDDRWVLNLVRRVATDCMERGFELGKAEEYLRLTTKSSDDIQPERMENDQRM